MKIIAAQETSEIISTRSYAGTLLIGSIPIIGDILLIKWSTDENVRKSKQNLCKAYIVTKTTLVAPIVIISGFIGFYIGLNH